MINIRTEKKMVKIKVEMDDTLQEIKDEAVEEMIDRLNYYIEENIDVDDWDTVYQHLSEDFYEIADYFVSIHNKEIDDLYYLHYHDLEESYNNNGFGDGKEDNHKMVTIYCVILDELYEKFEEIREPFEEWKDSIEDDLEPMTREQFIAHVKQEVL